MKQLKLKEHFDRELVNLLIKYATKGYYVVCHTYDISDKIGKFIYKSSIKRRKNGN